jgi:hypothetical protein
MTEKIKLELQKKLIDAQRLLSDVYDYACEYDLGVVESQMSCADSCIIESLDYIRGKNNE